MIEGKLKVLFISSWFPNRLQPTLGNFVEKHAESVSEYAEVAVLHVCFDPNLKQKKIEITKIFENNIFKTILYIKPPSGIFSGLRKFFAYTKAYNTGLKIIENKKGKQQIVHANVFFPIGIIAMMFKRKFNIPYVITEHWTGYHDENSNNISFVNKFVSKKTAFHSSFILPVSNHLGNAMKKIGMKGNYKRVANVVDTNLFQPEYSEKATSSIKKIVHISSLDDNQKNVSGIINAIQKLSEIRTDFELHIISDGDLKNHISLADSFGLTNKTVFFYGQKTSSEIAEILKNSSFLLLFSNYENLPCVIAEAFAAGIPVLSTNVGGISEFFNEKLGILIEAKNETELLSSLNKMLDKQGEFDKNYIHNYAKENFSYDVIGKELLQIYQETLKLKQIG